MTTIGSLFSGIGGLELGLERAGLGKTVWQCEKDEFCRSKLANHWPDVERYDDVTDATFPHADIICGGFPCQDLSHAGKRRGIRAERSGLWFEYLRIVREIRPAWVIVENVYQAWRAWMPIVRSGLAELGYASLPLRVSANEVGAWHRRARGFVVADSHGHIIRQQSGGGARAMWASAVQSVRARSPWVAPDANSLRKLQPGGTDRQEWGWAGDCIGEGWGEAGTIEPTLDRGVHGVSGGVAMVKALGNSVVPQCAEAVGLFVKGLSETS